MKDGIIISVTSFPARIPYIVPALKSIVRQKAPEDRVILWLGADKFPRRLMDVPDAVALFAAERGGDVEFRFVKDVRSFTKLVPALNAFPGKMIVTLDDDIIYPDGVVQGLKDGAAKYPGEVIAHCVSDLYRVHGKWRRTSGNVGFRFGTPFLRMVTGGGGALYPPGALDDLVKDTDTALRLSPMADDIWFWFCATRKGTPVRCIPNGITRHQYAPHAAGVGALSSYNEVDDDRGNLIQLGRLLDFDPDVEKVLLSAYGKNRLKILVSRLIRLFVRYPQQAVYCFRAGGLRFLCSEASRKMHHFRALIVGDKE